jgi:PilZ domain
MLSFLVHKNERREVRRQMTLACRVVREKDFQLLGTNAIDVSPEGMLVMAIRDAAPGDGLIVSFRATELGIWFDAEAKVARVVRGRRPKDRGRCIGISFTRFDSVSRLVLRGYLRRAAPPVPQRDARIDYAATVRKIALARA